MPDVRIVINGFPAGHAGEERIHQNEFRYFRGELRGVSIGDHQPDIVSHDLGPLHAERLRKIVNANGGALHIQAVRRNARVADAGEIGRNYGEALGAGRA